MISAASEWVELRAEAQRLAIEIARMRARVLQVGSRDPFVYLWGGGFRAHQAEALRLSIGLPGRVGAVLVRDVVQAKGAGFDFDPLADRIAAQWEAVSPESVGVAGHTPPWVYGFAAQLVGLLECPAWLPPLQDCAERMAALWVAIWTRAEAQGWPDGLAGGDLHRSPEVVGDDC